jgi:hypothetical protein
MYRSPNLFFYVALKVIKIPTNFVSVDLFIIELVLDFMWTSLVDPEPED